MKILSFQKEYDFILYTTDCQTNNLGHGLFCNRSVHRAKTCVNSFRDSSSPLQFKHWFTDTWQLFSQTVFFMNHLKLCHVHQEILFSSSAVGFFLFDIHIFISLVFTLHWTKYFVWNLSFRTKERQPTYLLKKCTRFISILKTFNVCPCLISDVASSDQHEVSVHPLSYKRMLFTEKYLTFSLNNRILRYS
jgi:hypothetical protein